MRSLALAQKQSQQLEQRLVKAEAALRALSLPRGRGKRQYWDETGLQKAVAQVLQRYGVAGLLRVTLQREEQTITRYVWRGRGAPNRPTRTQVQVRCVITARREAQAEDGSAEGGAPAEGLCADGNDPDADRNG